jgi:hypothetical protein
MIKTDWIFMLNKRSLRQFTPIILATLAIFSSCKEEAGTLGLDVLPTEDIFTGTDATSRLMGQNYDPVKLISSDPAYSILGSVNDPSTGPTEASFITEINLGERIGKLNKSSEVREYFIDSLVLNLAYYKEWWIGYKEAKHEISVHRFNAPLSMTETYYSDMPVDGLYDETPIATIVKSANDGLADTSWVQNDYANVWQFRLDDEVANEVFELNDSIMTDRKAFRETFGSLFIQSEPVDPETPGSLIEFSLTDDLTNMKMYYSYYVIDTADNANERVDTVQTSYTFPINLECVRVNRFTHNNQEAVTFNDKEAEHLIAQGMAGSMIEIDFNDITVTNEDGDPVNLFSHWNDKLDTEKNNEFSGISAVDIIFEADTASQYYRDENFFSPAAQALRLYKKEDDEYVQPGYNYSVSDTSEWSPAFTGGDYDEETGTYTFRMYKESFRMMVEKEELRGPYYLSTPDPASYPWKVLLKNSDDPENPNPTIRIKEVSIDTL